jgi:hypothetical protein
LKRICGYLKKYPEGAIRFWTEIPDYSHLEHTTYDWTYSVYGESKEEVPSDMPVPRGNKPDQPHHQQLFQEKDQLLLLPSAQPKRRL